MAARPRSNLIAAAALCALGGCGSGSSGASDGAATDDGSLFSCESETRAIAFATGVERMSDGGGYRARVTSAMPGVPTKGTDTWTVTILDAGGSPVDDALTKVVPFMPDHNHGTSVKAAVTANGGGGYTITPLYFFMAGYWEVTLTLQPATGTADSVMFPVCVPG